jgi:hypothetical protein
MIPVTATDADLTRYVDNITSAYKRATRDQRTRGANWYPTAHQLADMLSDGNPRMGAGVIAALSANKSWVTNQALAARCFTGDVSGHMKDALRKVERILAGERPEDVLPMTVKTGNFFRNIADPDDQEAVTIDRHAHDVAVGAAYVGTGGKAATRDRGLSNTKRYASLAHAYREAARKLQLTPSVLQAIVWLVQIEG